MTFHRGVIARHEAICCEEELPVPNSAMPLPVKNEGYGRNKELKKISNTQYPNRSQTDLEFEILNLKLKNEI
jgi:hypothetical protein